MFFALVLFITAQASDIDAICGGSNAVAISPFNITQFQGIWHQIAVSKAYEDIFEFGYHSCIC